MIAQGIYPELKKTVTVKPAFQAQSIEIWIARLALANPERGFGFTVGKKYFKVFTSDNGGSRSVYCFIDRAGNIYKAATWSAPAKGKRGNIACVKPEKVGHSTGWMYR
jgi:hypothetical protein